MDHEAKNLDDAALREQDPTGWAWEMSPILDGECVDGPSSMNAACEDRDGTCRSDWG